MEHKKTMENQELFQEASKYYYGVQNKYTDKMDFFNKQEEDLNNNLTYFNTYSATGSDIKNGNKNSSGTYSKDSKKFTLGHTSDTHIIDTDFINNIKIKNLSGEYIIRFSIGGQLIYILYSDIYNVVVKKFQISDINKNFVIIPMGNIPYPHYHLVEILIYSDNIENIEVFYDIYKYDSVKDPMKIIDDTFFNLVKMTKQIQYTGEESMDIRYQYRMNFNHPINSIGVNIPEEFDNSAMLNLNNEFKLKLTPSYRIGEFVVYEFPYINFSMVDNSKFVIEDENFTTLENVKLFAFDAQPTRTMSGFTGLMYSK